MEVQAEEYELKGPDAEAKGVFTDNGFLVKAGSLARREVSPSAKRVTSVHQRLIADGVLEEHGGKLRFAKDHLFNTPSGAAAAVLGRTANGWISWRRADGQTLSEFKRVSRNDQAPFLDEAKRQEIIARHRQFVAEGQVPPLPQLEKELALFRERFGPSVLAGLDGEPLLTLMHDSNRDSLVYWLEFKNDDEFGTTKFGGIAGGSALKFRIFRRKETGNWQAGGEKANQPQDITMDQAIEFARSHRDQLVRGAELLNDLSEDATDDDYAWLQDQMDELAPDVSRLGWGHKYFSLLFPNKLDDYHSPDWQRFHLIKLLQMPPEGNGRYVCAGRFVGASKEVGIPMNHFTHTLHFVHGYKHSYWRVGTTADHTDANFWQTMLQRNCIAVGSPDLGDISWFDGTKEAAEKLKKLLFKTYPDDPKSLRRDYSQLSQFVNEIKEGDIVLAADGKSILGIGRVTGSYEFHSTFEVPHQRQVEWVHTEVWQLPGSSEGLQSTVRKLGKVDENLLAIEQHLQQPTDGKKRKRLSGISARIQSILDRKGQVILYGPPGTGKTYWAEHTANDLAALSAFGKLFELLDEQQRKTVIGHGNECGLVRICCFHPAYGYEDFLEGYRPKTVDGRVSFELRDGVFKKLCKDALAAPERNHYLIVDEINRGDIPRIFGELLTTLEKDKRGKRIILPVSQEIFSVPRNVFILGTMNTADRSISLLDAALRRRFGFVELMPDGSVLKGSEVAKISLKAWLDALNARIREHVGRDARNLQIGHSYLMHGGSPLKDVAMLKRAIRDDIIPLLEEYCYEDYSTLGNILGEYIVDTATQRIRHELFDDGQEEALVHGLLAPNWDIAMSPQVLATDGSQAESVEDGFGAES